MLSLILLKNDAGGFCMDCCDVLVDFEKVVGLNVNDALIVGEFHWNDRYPNEVTHLDRTLIVLCFDFFMLGMQIC
jgi:hypothetical protein